MEPKSKDISLLSASDGGMSPVTILIAMPSTIADLRDAANGIQGLPSLPLYKCRAHKHGKLVNLYIGSFCCQKMAQFVDKD